MKNTRGLTLSAAPAHAHDTLGQQRIDADEVSLRFRL
jgi:hypothetical protein